MSNADREKWNAKYAEREVPSEPAPDGWLVEQVSELKPGRALELACGVGHNAVWLAQQGWSVDAVDVSPVGLSVAAKLARKAAADGVRWITADLDRYTPADSLYELVIVFRFLDRTTVPEIVSHALRPGGRLIYETFLRSHLERPENHLKNPAFTLEPGELPSLFPALTTLTYRETELPDRTVAQLVAEKPKQNGADGTGG